MNAADPFSRLGPAALEYARRFGFPVLPIHSIDSAGRCTCRAQNCGSAAKHPRTINGVKDATSNVATIQGWWGCWPDANIGLATGGHFLVLDVDARHGGEDALDDLQAKHGKLPSTVECLTGGDGRHLYFGYSGIEVRNSAGKLGPGLDVRAQGGYALVPPSMHATGISYCWELSSRIDEVSIAQAPGWFLALIREPSSEKRTARPASKWVNLIRGPIAEGARNDSLTRLAGHLFRIRILDPVIAAELVHAVNEARCQPPLALNEVDRIVQSIAGRELARERKGRR